MPFLGRDTSHSELGSLMQGAWGRADRQSGPAFGLEERLSTSVVQAQQRRLCDNSECVGGWTRPWRNRRRPIFEGQWGCSGRCVLKMMRAAIQRELGDGTESTVAVPHRHRVPLGLLMLSQGWITHSQLRKALDAQRASGTGRIGDWLQSECGLEPDRVVRGLSMQWGCPVLTTEGFSPEAMELVVPRFFIERLGFVPLRVAGSRILYLGFEDRLDASAAFAIEKMTDLKVENGLVEERQLRAVRSRLLECEGVETKLESVVDKDVLVARMTAILEQKQPVASRLVRLHQYYWMRIWLERGCLSKTGTLPTTREDVNDYVFVIGAQV